MTEVIINIVAKVSEYVVAPAIHTGSYLFCVGKLTRKLEKEKRKLTSAKDGVTQHAEEATKKTERIENVVEEWLQEVQTLLQHVENLEKEVRANNCFWNLCPTWRRYRLCKQLVMKMERMIELNNNSKFERFSCLSSLPTNITSSVNVMLFESTKWAFDTLLEAFKDDDCHIICLYGMGGCGKTTLAKEVGKRAEELKLFDKVIFTVLSQSPNVRKVQGEIADVLGLSPLNEESEAGRAKRLSLGLQNGGRVLVILDDVWGMLNLEDFGIPLDGNLKGCKILLTTRLQQLCSLMNGQRNVQLQLLSTEEAWAFFQKKACITEDSSLINTVAQEIAAECKGLPIAIQAVATTLKGKPLHSWKDALYKLRHSKPIGVDQGVKDAFACLQYSYDALTNQEAKRLFLMCSIFPEDHEMKREDLFRYGVGLGLFGEDDSFEDLRYRVNATLTNLLDYSLLMHCERGEDYFKIHDVVRDFVLWKSSEMDWCVIADHVKGIDYLALDGVIKNCSAISIWGKRKDDRFPPQLDNLKLEVILLESNNSLDLSQALFDGIEGLKVMAIGSWYVSKVSLPQSTQWLTNLRTLRLVRCDLGDISFVVCLKRLEILDLCESKFELLPKGIEELRKLKLLDLRYCEIIENCDEVIRRCSQLEELYVRGVEAFSGKCVIYSHNCLLDDVCFPNYQRYILQMGKFKGRKHIPFSSSTRVLYLGEANISTLNTFAKDLMQRAEAIFLESLRGGCKSIFPELVAVVGSMNQLIELRLECCSEIESILCSTPTQAYSNLRQLLIFNCPMLTSLLPTSATQTLSQLEVIEIQGCSELRHIVKDEGQSATDKGQGIFQVSNASDFMFPKLKTLEVRYCEKLQYVLRTLLAQRPMQQLEELNVEGCDEMKSVIFNEEEDGVTTRKQKVHVFGNSALAFPKLKFLNVSHCDKLEYVFGGDVAHDHSASQNKIQIMFPQLEEIHLKNLRSLVKICLENCYSSWPSLKHIRWFDCPKLTNLGVHGFETAECERSNELLEIKNCGVVNICHLQGDGHKNDHHEAITLKLEEVEMERLPELNFIWNGFNFTQILSLSYLRCVKLHQCGKLKCVFPSVIHISFPHLTQLILSNCEELEEIFSGNEELQSVSTTVQECFPKLLHLKVKGCTKLRVICSIKMARSFPELKFLSISESRELKEIFQSTNEIISDNEKEIAVPNLIHINLEKLPSLIDICQGFNFVAVELCDVQIHDCPKFIAISEAARYWRAKGVRIVVVMDGSPLSSNNEDPTLPLTYLWSKELDSCGVIDIVQIGGSVSVGGDDQHQVMMDSQVVRLGCEHELWRGPIPGKMMSLQYLHTLTVRRCGKLKFLLPMDAIYESLPELAFLTISDCEEMEQVIAEDKREEHNACNTAVSGCFPKLRELKVERCNKLKCLFPATLAAELPQLEDLLISDATELKQVFSRKSEGEKVVLPNLKYLKLVRLPRLVGSRNEMEIPNLLHFNIWDCPNISGFVRRFPYLD